MNEFILETFSDLCNQYDIKVNLKTKRTFQLFVMEDLPFEVKDIIKEKIGVIANKMGRNKFYSDNPYIVKIGDKNVITSGIWNIRIY
jgi:hypothetical protein